MKKKHDNYLPDPLLSGFPLIDNPLPPPGPVHHPMCGNGAPKWQSSIFRAVFEHDLPGAIFGVLVEDSLKERPHVPMQFHSPIVLSRQLAETWADLYSRLTHVHDARVQTIDLGSEMIVDQRDQIATGLTCKCGILLASTNGQNQWCPACLGFRCPACLCFLYVRGSGVFTCYECKHQEVLPWSA